MLVIIYNFSFLPALITYVEIFRGISGLGFLVLFILSILDWQLTKPTMKYQIKYEILPAYSLNLPYSIPILISTVFSFRRVLIGFDYSSDIEYHNQFQKVVLKKSSPTLVSLNFKFLNRGDISVPPISLRHLSVLWLWTMQRRFDPNLTANVHITLDPLNKIKLISTRRKLQNIGARTALKHGQSKEFDQLRDYLPDDEFRIINWKATAKRNKLTVSQFKLEQSREILLILDAGRLMHTEINGRTRIEHYIKAITELAAYAINDKDRVGLLVFSNQILRYIAPSSSKSNIKTICQSLYDIYPAQVESDYTLAFNYLRARHHKRGLAIIFTEIVDGLSSKECLKHVNLLNQSHASIVVTLTDPELIRESQVQTTNLASVYQRAAAEEYLADRQHALQVMKNRKSIIIDVVSSLLSGAVLNTYLKVKAEGRI